MVEQQISCMLYNKFTHCTHEETSQGFENHDRQEVTEAVCLGLNPDLQSISS